MTIGVVIPCKDYEQYLGECLASVRAQGADVRAVVVDDWSLNPYLLSAAAGDVPVICLPEPCGIGIARNVGAAFLNTEYLLFLDADDWLHEGAIKALYEELQTSKADFAYGNYTQNGATITTPAWDDRLLKTQNIASYCNLWDADSFWTLGGYSSVPVAEDWDLQRRASDLGYLGAHADANIFDHRVHDSNKWARDSITYGGLEGVSEWLRLNTSR